MFVFMLVCSSGGGRRAAQQREQQQQLIAELQAAQAAQAAQGTSDRPQSTSSASTLARVQSAPVHHQTLALMPTALARTLRATGMVSDITIPEIVAAFKRMDKDGNGLLDHKEITEALQE